MNAHARNQKYKLTMVSLYCAGKRAVMFIHLPLVDGRPVCSMDIINSQLSGVPRGTTFSVGA